MPEHFKVWAQIERIGDKPDDFEDIGSEDSIGGKFETFEQAQAFVDKLQRDN